MCPKIDAINEHRLWNMSGQRLFFSFLDKYIMLLSFRCRKLYIDIITLIFTNAFYKCVYDYFFVFYKNPPKISPEYIHIFHPVQVHYIKCFSRWFTTVFVNNLKKLITNDDTWFIYVLTLEKNHKSEQRFEINYYVHIKGNFI